jgi:hypothetical protein
VIIFGRGATEGVGNREQHRIQPQPHQKYLCVSETGYAFDVSYIHEMFPIGYTASVSFRDYAGRESASSAAGHPMHRDTHRQQLCQVVPDPALAGGGIGDAVVYPVALGLPGCSRSARVAVLGANAGNHS